MAFSQPKVYLDELAAPLCRRFENEPESYELAIATCIMLYHFADVVGRVRGRSAHQIANDIAVVIPQFDTVRAIANAAKHVELTRHPNTELIGLRAEHLKRGGGAAFDGGVYFSDGSTWADMPHTIVVETPDGRKHDVLYTCRTVLRGLREHSEFFEV